MATELRVCAGVMLSLGLMGGVEVADAVSPAQMCEAGKNREAGKYALCRQKAEANYALAGDAAALTAALERCGAKYAAKWPMLESRADGTCPSADDQSAIQAWRGASVRLTQCPFRPGRRNAGMPAGP